MTEKQKLRLFKRTLTSYYQESARSLPWRQPEVDGSFDPYKILVSEMMLQQTQVKRVIPKYHSFLKQFPNIQTLASAPLASVLTAWNGLGYNRRAKYLHDAARQLAAKELPWKLDDLTACKGIGPNTAAAVMVYAYNKPQIFIETNIRTVIIYHFFPDRTNVSDKEIVKALGRILPKSAGSFQYREFYWALMDYGTHLKSAHGNAAIRSKTYKKQPAFNGSTRQLRGLIIRTLIEQPYTLCQLQTLQKDNRLEAILVDLEREQIIRRQDGRYQLA